MRSKSEKICFIVSIVAIVVFLVSAVGSASGAGFLTLPSNTNVVLKYMDTAENNERGWPTYAGHKGTDYATGEDMPIKAAADGYAYLKVEIYRDGLQKGQIKSNGYGYYIDIDHGNGYWTRYAHIKEEGRVSGSVKRGQVIGKSSNTGAPWGSCYTPHLHFEVRKGGAWGEAKDPYSSKDWLWTTNPPSRPSVLSTQTSWHFSTPGNTEGWEAHNVEGAGYSVEGGGYFINPAGLDPWIQNDHLSIEAAQYDAIMINMASNCPDGEAAIYYTTFSSPNYDAYKKIPFGVKNDGTWNTYTVHINPIGVDYHWKGTITGLRIDPAIRGWSGTPSDTVGFNWVKLIKIAKPQPPLFSIYPTPTPTPTVPSAYFGDVKIYNPVDKDSDGYYGSFNILIDADTVANGLSVRVYVNPPGGWSNYWTISGNAYDYRRLLLSGTDFGLSREKNVDIKVELWNGKKYDTKILYNVPIDPNE